MIALRRIAAVTPWRLVALSVLLIAGWAGRRADVGEDAWPRIQWGTAGEWFGGLAVLVAVYEYWSARRSAQRAAFKANSIVVKRVPRMMNSYVHLLDGVRERLEGEPITDPEFDEDAQTLDGEHNVYNNPYSVFITRMWIDFSEDVPESLRNQTRVWRGRGCLGVGAVG